MGTEQCYFLTGVYPGVTRFPDCSSASPTAYCPVQRTTAYHHTLRWGGTRWTSACAWAACGFSQSSAQAWENCSRGLRCRSFSTAKENGIVMPKRTASSFPMCGIGVYLSGMIHKNLKTLYTKTPYTKKLDADNNLNNIAGSTGRNIYT